jgi:predicted phage terminase large subunit-like protein
LLFRHRQEILDPFVFAGALDPSLGRVGRNRDDSAIVSLLVDRRTGIKYVLDASIARLQPDEIIDAVIAHHERRRYDRFAAEAVQYQEFLASELTRRSRAAGLSVPVEAVRPTRDKLGRIQALQPRVRNGEIRFCRRHRLLLDQLRTFPKASHDDGPDALEMRFSGGRLVGWIFEH